MIDIEVFRAGVADKYRVERELGRGGMATVFLATDVQLSRQVAVKVLHPDLSATLGAERFQREISIATALKHPNILALYDSGEAAGYFYYVMPFVEGESLRDRLARERQLPIDDAVRIAVEVANALDYAHRHGVIHRDIKPENILLEDGHALVADFGVARALSAASDEVKLTQTGMAIGTPAYMSPEQGLADKSIDGRSDQYALGCVIYEMLAGQAPFQGSTMIQLVMRHALEPVPPLRIQRQTVGEDLEAVIFRALAKAPADRWPTLKEFAQALVQPVGVTWTWRTSGTMAGVQPPARPKPKRQLLVAALVAVTAIGGGAVAWSQMRSANATPVAGGADARRIAVTYFDDASGARSLGYLADGLTESLIEVLDRVDDLDVVSSGGVAPFRGTTVARDSIARALRAGTLVSGSVDTEGNRVRVTVKLADGDGVELDRRTFTAPAREVLAIRDSLASEVADFLKERLGAEIKLRRERAETSSPDAWVLVQRAEQARRRAEDLAAAGKAAAADLAFAQADSLVMAAARADERWIEPEVQRAWIAYRRALAGARAGEMEPTDVVRLIESAVGHADIVLRRQARNTSALEVRGTARYLLYLAPNLVTDPREKKRALEDAEKDLAASTRADPKNASAWTTLSHLYSAKPDFAQAKLAALNAYEEDAYLSKAPDILSRLYQTSYLPETFNDAHGWCAEGFRRFPRDPRFVDCQIWLLTLPKVAPTPNPDSAWRLLDSLEARLPKGGAALQRHAARIPVAIVLGRAGLVDSAKRVLARNRDDSGDIDKQGDLLSFEAYALLTLGDRDAALQLLERYVTAHPDHREGWRNDSAWWWRTLAGDPRFERMMAGSSR